MRDRASLAAMTALLAVQRVQRIGAEAAVAAASEAERLAREDEARARQEAEAAQEDWLGGLAEPGFAPDYQRALAARLLVRDQERADRAGDALRAAEATGLRQQAWRKSEARVRASEIGARRLSRKLARRDEERRLAEIADYTTGKWVRR
jgi:hypothetical protein